MEIAAGEWALQRLLQISTDSAELRDCIQNFFTNKEEPCIVAQHGKYFYYFRYLPCSANYSFQKEVYDHISQFGEQEQYEIRKKIAIYVYYIRAAFTKFKKVVPGFPYQLHIDPTTLTIGFHQERQIGLHVEVGELVNPNLN